MNLKTPVLFLIFNRPKTTQRVFDVIRQAKPPLLFVAADGPRNDRPCDVGRCEKTRQVIETVDWECEVVTLYREKNLGCRKAVSSAIDWFFENVKEGIVLEDDCLPSLSFFFYCQELLEHYRDDMRVMQICGSNVLNKWDRNGRSYFFSNYGPVWGWASWRRAWDYYDVDMKLWSEIREKKIYEDFCLSSQEAVYRLDLYDMVFSGRIDTWDYQWGFAKMLRSGLSIIPADNLISNIGFGPDATHTKSFSSFSGLLIHNIDFPLKHPEFVIRDKLFDVEYNQTYLPNDSKSTNSTVLQKFMHALNNYWENQKP
jgi:hypothetical protein